MTELEYFRLLAPEFSVVDDTTVSQWLAIAANLVNVSCLDAERAAMAIALYAAHMLSLNIRSGQGGAAAQGAVISEKEGDLQRSYSAVKGGDTYIGQTLYGQQYLDIMQSCSGAAIMTRVGA